MSTPTGVAPADPISETDLHAYIDGALDDARRDEVERYLQDHATDAARVAAYAAQRDALRAALAEWGEAPIPARLNPHVMRQQRNAHRMGWAAAAGIVLALGAGGTGGWVLRGQLAPQAANTISIMVQEAVANHVVYTADKRRPTELGAEQRDDLARWVSNRIQTPVAPPDLSDFGYHYIGGRLAATSHGPAGMFMYQNDKNVRMTVFVRPTHSTTDKAMELVGGAGQIDGCAWIEKGVGYTVVAPVPPEELRKLAQQVHRMVDHRA